MKQYFIDGLDPRDYLKLKRFFKKHFGDPALGSIYWIELDKNILSPLQKEHKSCSPHVFAIDLNKNSLSCEFLVRIKSNIKCDCMSYADTKQREWLMTKIDGILDKLEISI
ncbi:MAG: hypothetical protein B6I26_06780 [Desulfobacteraceae bacterium 4572_130]|nr:MAG: hypothetical protein B6I26_06780 [Desulfobacteraceae bacterium 4572_130]